MNIVETGFKDLLVLQPTVYNDNRGCFMESYNYQTLAKVGIRYSFVQDNQSFSRRGVLRGLHFQKNPYAQAKLVRVLKGRILDVVVDLRVDQPTYKHFFNLELSDENRKQLMVPKGFAHGFVVLSETAQVLYKCDEYYNKSSESGIRFDDPELSIDWVVNKDELIISEKDLELPFLKNLNNAF